ncbi:hypothetical protein [Streptomyces canus]|uniref:hypothetical protein n=1 Tax=Streptomyces canus TaxID=58343 RepID=UPI00039F5A0F|nr:hypothetical protein [Streptomyces canus]
MPVRKAEALTEHGHTTVLAHLAKLYWTCSPRFRAVPRPRKAAGEGPHQDSACTGIETAGG